MMSTMMREERRGEEKEKESEVRMEGEGGRSLSGLLHSAPGAVPAALELITLFCHGIHPNITADNVIPIICVAHQMGVADSHNTLFTSTLSFFKSTVLPSWSNTLRSLHSSHPFLHHASHLGLLSSCFHSLSSFLTPKPNNNNTTTTTTSTTTTRRKLFPADIDDLTTLPLEIYLLLIQALAQTHVPPPLISTSLSLYLTRWVFSQPHSSPPEKKKVVEAIEGVMPMEEEEEEGVLSVKMLCKLHKEAVMAKAEVGCVRRVEERIGRRLEEAEVEDVVMVLRTCEMGKEEYYGGEGESYTEGVRSMMKHFYVNYRRGDVGGMERVGEVMEGVLGEVAEGGRMRVEDFRALGEMAGAATGEMRRRRRRRGGDGIYVAVDRYLERNGGGMTEEERERVCEVVDGGRLSREACMHAAQNSRLPTRVLMRILLAAHVWLRTDPVEDEEEEEEQVVVVKEEVGEGGGWRRRRGRWGVWGAVKRKLGCGGDGDSVVAIQNGCLNGGKMMKMMNQKKNKKRRLLSSPLP